MPFYTKKPVEIEARLLTKDNVNDIAEWCCGMVDVNDLTAEMSIKIYTLEGVMTGNVGDYIIKGVKDEFYPCRADIFAATYEEAVPEIDPWHIEITSIEDNPDGSALADFVLGAEANKFFLQQGIVYALRRAIKHEKNELDEIDTNVGC